MDIVSPVMPMLWPGLLYPHCHLHPMLTQFKVLFPVSFCDFWIHPIRFYKILFLSKDTQSFQIDEDWNALKHPCPTKLPTLLK